MGVETPAFLYPENGAITNAVGSHRLPLTMPWLSYADVVGGGETTVGGEAAAFYAQGLYEDDGNADLEALPDMVNALFSQTIMSGEYNV